MKVKNLLLIITLFLGTSFAKAQNYNVYAAFIYNIAKNMSFTQGSSGDFVVTIVGKSPLEQSLKKLAASKTIGTQKIVIKTVGSVSEVKNAQLVYLSNSKSGEFSQAVEKVKSSKSVLITSKNGFGKKGAGVNFVDQAGKVKFEMNKSALKASSIKVSAKIESLAIIVG